VTVLPTSDNNSLMAWAVEHNLGLSCGIGACLSAYRQDLTALLREAAAGRREYAVNAPDSSALVLEDEARQLETVIRLIEGDMAAMTAWLPSWRWTDAMTRDLEKR
jgi:hypothetical protein